VGLSLRCGDIVGECDFEVHGETEEEILLEIEKHIATIHGLYGITKIINEELRKFIRDEIPGRRLRSAS